MSLNSIARSALKLAQDNSPAILSALAISGVVSTAVLTAKATPPASEAVRRHVNGLDPAAPYPTRLEIVKLTWKFYIPAATVGAVSIACIIGANTVNTRRNAALASAYTLTETMLTEYKAKVVETVGEKKAEDIRSEIAKERAAKAPVDSSLVVLGTGKFLCYDTITGRYFESNMDILNKAQNDINYMAINNMYASHNDFYSLVGLPTTAFGEEVGWAFDHKMELDFSSFIGQDDRPVLSIEYRTMPIHGYSKVRR